MLEVTSIVKSWDNFTDISNAHEKLFDTYTTKQIELYLKSIQNLPIHWEDSITSLKWLTDEQLELMSKGLTDFKDSFVIVSDRAIRAECHVVAKHLKEFNPDWQLVQGFCATEEGCGTEWHFHSFCINEEGTIIEPTPIIRDRYFGIICS